MLKLTRHLRPVVGVQHLELICNRSSNTQKNNDVFSTKI